MLKVQTNWVVGLYLSVLVLLPFSRLSELPLLFLSLIGIIVLFKNFSQLKYNPQFKIATIVFSTYVTMVLISALDSYWQEKSLTVALSSLRFYFSSVALIFYIRAKHAHIILKVISLIAIIWAIDALFQYFMGFDLIGRSSYQGRLNGVFGEHHVKLGPVLTLLLPMFLVSVIRQKQIIKWLSLFILCITILLSGTRSAWLMMAFTLLAFWITYVKENRFKLFYKALFASLVLMLCLWYISPEFQARIDRSLNALDGTQSGVDFALANRLPIWKTSWNMIEDHPVNGVGAHAFRKAYPEYAEVDDVWQSQGGVGMHAHHWVLEVLAETGIIGLLLILFAIFKLYDFLKRYSNGVYSWAFSVALISIFLPITSTYSIFASFWSICIWFIGAGLIAVSKKDD